MGCGSRSKRRRSFRAATARECSMALWAAKGDESLGRMAGLRPLDRRGRRSADQGVCPTEPRPRSEPRARASGCAGGPTFDRAISEYAINSGKNVLGCESKRPSFLGRKRLLSFQIRRRFRFVVGQGRFDLPTSQPTYISQISAAKVRSAQIGPAQMRITKHRVPAQDSPLPIKFG